MTAEIINHSVCYSAPQMVLFTRGTGLRTADIKSVARTNAIWRLVCDRTERFPLRAQIWNRPTGAKLISEILTEQRASIENSEFSFESVVAGKYTLSLLWDDLEIQVDELAVGYAEAV